MRHHKMSTMVRWAKEGRVECWADFVVGRTVEVKFMATGKVVWVQVEAG